MLEHRHNHHINSLEVLSFKMLSDEARKEVNSLFLNNLTPSQAYNTYLLNLEKDCEDNLNVQLRKVNISKCPRQGDFNSFILNTLKKILERKIAQKCFVILKSK